MLTDASLHHWERCFGSLLMFGTSEQSEKTTLWSVTWYERPPKPSTIGNSCTGTMIFDTIMKLSGNRGLQYTKNDDFWYTSLPDFWIWRHSSSKLISARDAASESCVPRAKISCTICTKWPHVKNSKVEGSSERWPNRWPSDDNFLSLWVLTDTSPQRALKWLPCW